MDDDILVLLQPALASLSDLRQAYSSLADRGTRVAERRCHDTFGVFRGTLTKDSQIRQMLDARLGAAWYIVKSDPALAASFLRQATAELRTSEYDLATHFGYSAKQAEVYFERALSLLTKPGSKISSCRNVAELDISMCRLHNELVTHIVGARRSGMLGKRRARKKIDRADQILYSLGALLTDLAFRPAFEVSLSIKYGLCAA